MNTKRLYWVADSGHEWLAVPSFMARQIDGISSFSYISPFGDIAYLEGDCDAALLLAHYKLDGAELGATKLYERLAPCRNYPRYAVA
jgi:hypothetical protein